MKKVCGISNENPALYLPDFVFNECSHRFTIVVLNFSFFVTFPSVKVIVSCENGKAKLEKREAFIILLKTATWFNASSLLRTDSAAPSLKNFYRFSEDVTRALDVIHLFIRQVKKCLLSFILKNI